MEQGGRGGQQAVAQGYTPPTCVGRVPIGAAGVGGAALIFRADAATPAGISSLQLLVVAPVPGLYTVTAILCAVNATFRRPADPLPSAIPISRPFLLRTAGVATVLTLPIGLQTWPGLSVGLYALVKSVSGPPEAGGVGLLWRRGRSACAATQYPGQFNLLGGMQQVPSARAVAGWRWGDLGQPAAWGWCSCWGRRPSLTRPPCWTTRGGPQTGRA
jgi:hypothetical protein